MTINKLEAVAQHLAQGRLVPARACLLAFIQEARSQQGRHLESDTAAYLIAAATRINTVLLG